MPKLLQSGAIKIVRDIQAHWIWQDANKLKWWLDILLTVNSQEAKVNLGNDVFICHRGESLMSIQNWAQRWNIGKDTARNFLKLLEKDKMIKCVSIGKSTRLTVCNFDTYNPKIHVKQTDAERDADTNNILKRKEVFKLSLKEYLNNPHSREILNGFFKYWTELNKSKTKMRFELEKTWELNLRLSNWKRKAEEIDFKQVNGKGEAVIQGAIKIDHR